MFRLSLLILLMFFYVDSFANGSFVENFVSYFASIKSSEVNVRRGPNHRYPIEWVYKKKGEPVEVIAQFEHWYRIKDFNGDEGWVKSTMITKKRRGIVSIEQIDKKNKKKLYGQIYDEPNNKSNIIAKVEHSKRVDITQCKKQWCKIKIAKLTGWIEKQQLWGVYRNEEFK